MFLKKKKNFIMLLRMLSKIKKTIGCTANQSKFAKIRMARSTRM